MFHAQLTWIQNNNVRDKNKHKSKVQKYLMRVSYQYKHLCNHVYYCKVKCVKYSRLSSLSLHIKIWGHRCNMQVEITPTLLIRALWQCASKSHRSHLPKRFNNFFFKFTFHKARVLHQCRYSSWSIQGYVVKD